MSLRGEAFNTLSHLIGAILAVAVMVLLVVFASLYGNVWHIISFSLFGTTLILLYLASTLYHFSSHEAWRARLQRVDHAMILVFIAGTYTPFTLTVLPGGWGWSIFGVVWGVALIGVIWKFVAKKITGWHSTLLYVLMGWVILVAIYPLSKTLSKESMWYLVLGGILYTIGAFIYSLEHHPRFAHTTLTPHNIFHILVLLGSTSHVLAITKII